MTKTYFVVPKITKVDGISFLGYHSYSEYNYLQKSLISKIKRRHFEIALNLTSNSFYTTNVIDFGCADGIFLPSLSRYFASVLGIEQESTFVILAQKLIDDLKLTNVKIINNGNLSTEQIKKESIEKEYKIIFLLEVLEHFGRDYKTMYEDKIVLLKELFSLIDDDGIIVLSVPKMIGISFFIHHIGLWLFNMQRSKYSLKEFMKAAFFNDTSDLEKYWVPCVTHQGFNHKKLEKYLDKDFIICNKTNDIFQVLYVIKKR
jgi:2-polyprenyl-3-methyl-5-hydroxy-6-metoxy-1,4-benzoquinol methylase